MTRTLLLPALLLALATGPAVAQNVPAFRPAPGAQPAPPPIPSTPAPATPAPPTAAPAQPAPQIPAGTLAAARDLIQLQRLSEQYAGVGSFLVQQMEQSMTQANPLFASDQRLMADFRDVARQVDREMTEARGQALSEAAARVLATRFTEPELRQVIEFMRTPTGQKFLSSAGAVSTETFAAMEDTLRQQSTRMFERIRAEMARRGHRI